MLQKRIPFGKQCYILGMVLIEVTRCARWLRNLMESAFGDISVLDGYVSLLLFKFEVGDVNLFAFEMMLGVGKCLFVRHSLPISHCTTPRGLGVGKTGFASHTKPITEATQESTSFMIDNM